MTEFETSCAGGKIRLSAWGSGIIRLRAGGSFEPSLFERYGIFSAPEDFDGEIAEDGLRAGPLSASVRGGKVRLAFPGSSVSVELIPDASGMSAEFISRTNNFRPPRDKVFLTDEKEGYGTTEIVVSPKAAVIEAGEDELFYGLGTSNDTGIILNGKTYLLRVMYTINEIPIPVILSSAGWGVLSASTFWHAVDVCEDAPGRICWFLTDGDPDFFFFAAKDLAGLLERFTRVAGRPALLPKWGYGLTFIDQYHADQFEVMRNAAAFREKRYPCDMISLEPGWMEKEYDLSENKNWNIKRFYVCEWMRKGKPSRQTFISALRRYGFKTALWLCCNHDFTAHEENLAGNPTDFGINPWFDHLRRFAEDGVNAFKLDPNRIVDGSNEQRVYANGLPERQMHNLCQTLYSKEMAQGFEKHMGIRDMHHFCGGYTGTAQYGAANTGDNGGGHRTMVWVLNLGISGNSNTTCDMDIYSPQALHYCFFTGWCELNSWSGFSHPWWAGDKPEECFAFYDRLRYELMPYIYSAAIEANLTGMPIVRAMPLMFSDPETRGSVNQFCFGGSLLVGAFTDRVFLPRGERWIDFYTSQIFEGGQWVTCRVPENRGGPLFIRAGSAIPTCPGRQFISCEDEPELRLRVFAGGSGSCALYEDDGVSLNYRRGKRAVTRFETEDSPREFRLSITPRSGKFEGMGARTYRVLVKIDRPSSVSVGGKEIPFDYSDGYCSFGAGDGCSALIRK